MQRTASTLRSSRTEVQDSEWLQAQIEAGLIAVAEEEQADTPKRGRGKAASESESTEKTE